MCRRISLAACFFSLGNVRPQFRSSLKAIYLVSLAQSEDIDKYGLLGAHHSTNSGINRRSILEDIPGFSVVSGLPHDIMHHL